MPRLNSRIANRDADKEILLVSSFVQPISVLDSPIATASRELIDDEAPSHYDQCGKFKIRLGMSVFGLRHLISLGMTILLPLTMLAADTGSAVVHSNGGLWVNGAEVTDSTAVFAGDSLETKPGFVANLDAQGSSVLIQPESIVKFQGEYVVLEHGSVAVGTSTAMSVRVNCLKVEPIENSRTQYEVTDLSGKVDVAARKNDVNIKHSGAIRKASSEGNSGGSSTVHEGQQGTRYESTECGAPTAPHSAGSGLNTKWAEIGGGGGGAVLLCVLLCKGKPASSVSPTEP